MTSDDGETASSGWLSTLVAADNGLDPALVERKYAAMRDSPFSFMCATSDLFYRSGIDITGTSVIAAAPPAWLCGDLHVEHFGVYKGDNRLAYFDVNDFGAAARGPVTLDLVRLLASIRVGAAEWGVPDDDVDGLLNRSIVAYSTQLALAKPAWIERENARGTVKRLFAQVTGRSRSDLLARFTNRKGKRRRLDVDGRRLIAATDEERARVEQMLSSIASAARDAEYFRVTDVARRVSNVTGPMFPAFTVLIEGRGSPDRNVLLDLALARPSAIGMLRAHDQPAWRSEADRVVSVQRHSAVVAPAFLFSAECDGQSYISREFQADEDRMHLRDWEKQPKKIAEAIVLMASVAAWMHLRGGGWLGSAPVEQLAAFGDETSWREPVLQFARDAADRTRQQYREFVAAYADGYFKPSMTNGTPTDASVAG